jgi:hypothetical protein
MAKRNKKSDEIWRKETRNQMRNSMKILTKFKNNIPEKAKIERVGQPESFGQI